jgi:hypothetical protein
MGPKWVRLGKQASVYNWLAFLALKYLNIGNRREEYYGENYVNKSFIILSLHHIQYELNLFRENCSYHEHLTK